MCVACSELCFFLPRYIMRRENGEGTVREGTLREGGREGVRTNTFSCVTLINAHQ